MGASKAPPVPLYCIQHWKCHLVGFAMASNTGQQILVTKNQQGTRETALPFAE